MGEGEGGQTRREDMNRGKGEGMTGINNPYKKMVREER